MTPFAYGRHSYPPHQPVQLSDNIYEPLRAYPRRVPLEDIQNQDWYVGHRGSANPVCASRSEYIPPIAAAPVKCFDSARRQAPASTVTQPTAGNSEYLRETTTPAPLADQIMIPEMTDTTKDKVEK